MSAAHTPGPWVANYKLLANVEAENGAVIAKVQRLGSLTTMQANQRLIAAAPEQNELLQTFTEWARQVAARTDLPQGIRTAAANLADDGKRLISKATGEAS